MIFGGKRYLADEIVSLMPPHEVYVEVFGGGAAVLFAKVPSPVEVYNDIDFELVNFFRVLRDPVKFEEFCRQVSLIPYSRAEFEFYRDLEPCDDVERAVRTFVLIAQSFDGRKLSWSYSLTSDMRPSQRYFNRIKELPLIHARLQNVCIENADFRQIIERYDSEESLFYMDPPYIEEVRRSKKIYDFEMGLEDHRDLVDMLLKIKGSVILSCYYHDVYAPLIGAGWERRDYEVFCWSVGRTRGTGIKGEGALAAHKRVETVLIKTKQAAKRQLSLLNLEGYERSANGF
jgi:DNA adenine methylase